MQSVQFNCLSVLLTQIGMWNHSFCPPVEAVPYAVTSGNSSSSCDHCNSIVHSHIVRKHINAKQWGPLIEAEAGRRLLPYTSETWHMHACSSTILCLKFLITLHLWEVTHARHNTIISKLFMTLHPWDVTHACRSRSTILSQTFHDLTPQTFHDYTPLRPDTCP